MMITSLGEFLNIQQTLAERDFHPVEETESAEHCVLDFSQSSDCRQLESSFSGSRRKVSLKNNSIVYLKLTASSSYIIAKLTISLMWALEERSSLC